jgi:hypothetical protein
MVDRKVVPFDEFYCQLKLMHLFQKHPVENSEVVLSGAIFLSRLIGIDDTFCFEENWKGLDFIGV